MFNFKVHSCLPTSLILNVACVADSLNLLYKWLTRVRGPAATRAKLNERSKAFIASGLPYHGAQFPAAEYHTVVYQRPFNRRFD